MNYDWVVVGAGLYGAVFTQQCVANGKRVLVIDKRNHIGGNCYTETVSGIHVHKYGPHIFHTSNEEIWNYVNQFDFFKPFVFSPLALSGGKTYALPFNMWTFQQLWGVTSPKEAKAIIDVQRYRGKIRNLEDQAKALVGTDVYETLIRDYTAKQWQKHPRDLPAFIIKRLPVRFEYNSNYFNDVYQGIPVNGYTHVIKGMLDGADVVLEQDYFSKRDYYDGLAKNVLYTGPIDRFYDYSHGKLEYRSLRFEEKLHRTPQHGVSVTYHSDSSVPQTRTIEHKFFAPASSAKSAVSVVSKEYPTSEGEPYYPINTSRNDAVYATYKKLTKQQNKVLFGGRLAEYRYYDMHQVIGAALSRYFKVTSIN